MDFLSCCSSLEPEPEPEPAAGTLDESTAAIPVVGQNIVVGSKDRKDTKILVRPPHTIPAATWHKSPNLDAEGPLDMEQVERRAPPSPLTLLLLVPMLLPLIRLLLTHDIHLLLLCTCSLSNARPPSGPDLFRGRLPLPAELLQTAGAG